MQDVNDLLGSIGGGYRDNNRHIELGGSPHRLGEGHNDAENPMNLEKSISPIKKDPHGIDKFFSGVWGAYIFENTIFRGLY